MSSHSSSQGVGIFSCSDYEKVQRVKYIELRTFSLSDRKTRQPLNYFTGDSISNGDKQWERTMYRTDCDSSKEEDDPEYCDSSSDESSESANR